MLLTKICKGPLYKKGIILENDNFFSDVSKKTRLSTFCKKCSKEQSMEYRKKDRKISEQTINKIKDLFEIINDTLIKIINIYLK